MGNSPETVGNIGRAVLSTWPHKIDRCRPSITQRERSRMKHATADKLVYAHEALHLQHTRQSAAWKPSFEAWDTDTEDEDEDDEGEVFDVDLTACDLPAETILALMV